LRTATPGLMLGLMPGTVKDLLRASPLPLSLPAETRAMFTL